MQSFEEYKASMEEMKENNIDSYLEELYKTIIHLDDERLVLENKVRRLEDKLDQARCILEIGA